MRPSGRDASHQWNIRPELESQVSTEVVGKGWMDDTDHGDLQKGGNMRPQGTSILMHDGEKATNEQNRDRKRRARRLLCPGAHTSEGLPQGQ